MRRTLRLGGVLLGLALCGAAAEVSAQRPRPWQQLSPEEQQRAWDNYQRYRQLPEGRQRFMERRYEKFRAMPPEEQQRLRQNYQRYRQLDPAQRRHFVEKYRRWKDQR